MTDSLPDTLLARLSESLAFQTGLHFPPERWPDLQRGVAGAAREFDLASTESYTHALLSSPWTRSQIEILASHLTVGETYFFRHWETLAILKERVLPGLIHARREAGRQLRIWCAGCCTGEEPYSLAILLREILFDWKDWNLTILGTDINPHFLRKASQGVYGEWSFRETDPGIRRKYFTSPRKGFFEILPEIKEMVTFAYLNLAQDPYPALLNDTNAMDLILCRNVLMYFAPKRAQEVVHGLHRSLVDGGWLVVSPSEVSHVLFSEFVSVHLPTAVLYRKDSEGTPGSVIPLAPLADEEEASLPASLPAIRASIPVSAPEPAQPILTPAERARACANQGNLTEALEWSERAIAQDRLNPAGHYLLAAILKERGRLEEAAAALKRVLYLDQDFALAHFALGSLRQRQGKSGESRRHFENALRVLGAHPREQALPESDGITAGRLMEIIQSMR